MSLVEGPVYNGSIHVGDVVAVPGGLEFRSLRTGVGPAPTHKTSFFPEAFLAELTEDEFDLLDASNNATVKKFMRRLEGRSAGLVTVTLKYVSDIGALLTNSIISQERHDILVKGVPDVR